jgi:hypothetical protein
VRLTREHTLAEPSELRRVLLSGGEVVPPRTPADAARVVRRDANDLEHRVVPVPPQDLVSDDDLHDELWTVIEALDASGVYLVNTEHMADRDLYARLYYRILDEPTRCLPPDSEAAEYIDCLHPMDLNPGSMGSRMFERMEKRGAPKPVAREDGTRGPVCRNALCDRDRWLPRPGV